MSCRFPFLLVDRVIELEPEKYAIGYKNVTINDNFFPGHFPQRAIMPGKVHWPHFLHAWQMLYLLHLNNNVH